MPAKAGIQFLAKALGPRFRGDERNFGSRALSFLVESELGSSFLFEHDLFRKPVPTFRDHALRHPAAISRTALGIGNGLLAESSIDSTVMKIISWSPRFSRSC